MRPVHMPGLKLTYAVQCGYDDYNAAFASESAAILYARILAPQMVCVEVIRIWDGQVAAQWMDGVQYLGR